ncbi:glutamate racemase [candidate division BRC1 bacterium HGW-BRC1-1]|jgi:glutamate racemase|nr:MAG: glutamate racemase [candidate division BRC1 bacterium HGW-BRC1-1]
MHTSEKSAAADGPVGIFDSGVGGMSVAMEIARQMPREPLLYFADSGRAPWGGRPPDEVRAFAREITQRLLDEGAKLIVVACNTASVHALQYLRGSFPGVPFVGMVPAVKTAALRTVTGHIAVMATTATAQGPALEDLLKQFAHPNGIDAVLAIPSGLVEQVERGELNTPRTQQLVREALAPLLDTEVDTLVLGCTHFPFLSEAVRAVTEGRMTLVDPAAAVAAQVGRVLMDRSLAAPAGQRRGMAAMRLLTSGDPEVVAATVEHLTGERIKAEKA